MDLNEKVLLGFWREILLILVVVFQLYILKYLFIFIGKVFIFIAKFFIFLFGVDTNKEETEKEKSSKEERKEEEEQEEKKVHKKDVKIEAEKKKIQKVNLKYYSHSRLSKYEQCPKAFEYHYIENIKPDFENTIEQYLGKCIHEAIEKAYLNPKSSLEDIIEYFYDAWQNDDLDQAVIIRSNTDTVDYYQTGEELIDLFYNNIYGKKDGTTIELEKKFKIKLSNGYTYTGIIDRIARMQGGRLRIIDFKTGKRVPDPVNDLQIRSYALHALQKYKKKKVEVCYIDLRNGRRLISNVSDSDCIRIDKILTDKIRIIEDETYFATKRSPLCSWCSYNQTCSQALYYSKPLRY